jgi:ketosteroid isomerase-like protein
MSSGQGPEQIVRDWIAVVNAGDTANVDHLLTDSVSIIGPRGVARGREVVADWTRHTGIRMTIRDVSVDGDRVTVFAEGTWLVEGGAPDERTPPARITMRFTVSDGRIASIERL